MSKRHLALPRRHPATEWRHSRSREGSRRVRQPRAGPAHAGTYRRGTPPDGVRSQPPCRSRGDEPTPNPTTDRCPTLPRTRGDAPTQIQGVTIGVLTLRPAVAGMNPPPGNLSRQARWKKQPRTQRGWTNRRSRHARRASRQQEPRSPTGARMNPPYAEGNEPNTQPKKGTKKTDGHTNRVMRDKRSTSCRNGRDDRNRGPRMGVKTKEAGAAGRVAARTTRDAQAEQHRSTGEPRVRYMDRSRGTEHANPASESATMGGRNPQRDPIPGAGHDRHHVPGAGMDPRQHLSGGRTEPTPRTRGDEPGPLLGMQEREAAAPRARG